MACAASVDCQVSLAESSKHTVHCRSSGLYHALVNMKTGVTGLRLMSTDHRRTVTSPF